jgi:hypothetical protein
MLAFMRLLKKSKRKKLFLINFLVIILVFLCFFLVIFKKTVYKRIDLISDFDSAAKINFDEANYMEKYLPLNRYAIDASMISGINAKLFSGEPTLLNNNGKDVYNYESLVSDGSFRTVLKSLPERPLNFSYYFKKTGSGNYWVIDFIIGEIHILEIKEVVNSAVKTIDRFEIPIKRKISTKLNILFTGDWLFIFTDQEILFQCKHPRLKKQGTIAFKNQLSGKIPDFSVKFKSLDNALADTLMEKINLRFPSIPYHSINYADLSWNLLNQEDRLIDADIKSSYLRRLKREDTTMPVIYFFPGSSLEYNLKASENSLLSFYLALYHPTKSVIPDGKFIVKISAGNAKQSDKYEYNCRDLRYVNPAFKRYSINMKKYAGRKCDITFKFEARQEELKERHANSPVIALGSPVIYPLRERKEKNVILVSIDTLRPDHLGCYGYARNTSPNIDKFAKDSIFFLNATAQSNWTLTSHMSLFASLFPFETGYTKGRGGHQNVRFSDKVKLLPEYLKENGYKTGAITGGGYVSEYFGFDRGIDYYHVREDCSSAMTKAIEWLEESGNSKFFLFFHTYEVHKPYIHDDFIKELGPKATTLLEQTIAKYDSGILFTDRQIDWVVEKEKPVSRYPYYHSQ